MCKCVFNKFFIVCEDEESTKTAEKDPVTSKLAEDEKLSSQTEIRTGVFIFYNIVTREIDFILF